MNQEKQADQSSKKVIYVMVDTQRWDMLGCYGRPEMHTPALDKLAEEGMRFERAYDVQPVCGPARSGIFTGTFPHSNGSWTNSMALSANWKHIGQRLTDNGIHSAYIGKWHLDGGDYFGLGTCPEGFDPDYWYDMKNYLDELESDECRVASRQEKTAIDPGVKSEDCYAHRCTDRAIDFLERYHDQDSYFLALSYDEPHGPCLCPEPYASMFKDYEFPKSPNIWDDLEDKPEHLRTWSKLQEDYDPDDLVINARLFFGSNAYVDSQIGRFMETVNRLAPDALIIYTSDHGDALNSHHIYGKGPSMYDEIARVPFLVRMPGTPAGSVCPHPISHVDITPTIMDYMGLPIPKLLEGKSLLPCFRDPELRINEYVFTEFNRYEVDHDGFGGFQPMRGTFDGRYKLTIHLLSGDELYDMEEDPHEMHNLLLDPAMREVRNRLHDAILDWMNETRDPFRGYYWERRPWRDDAREASWDYTGMTRQRENEEYEHRQLDYGTGLPMKEATRLKG